METQAEGPRLSLTWPSFNFRSGLVQRRVHLYIRKFITPPCMLKIWLQHTFTVKNNSVLSVLAVQSPPNLEQQPAMAEWRLLCLTDFQRFCDFKKGMLWRKTYYHRHRVDLDLQTQSGYYGSPSPAPLRCKEADGFDPWSHFLTRLRCQITFWPRKHFQVAWATSDLAMIGRSIQFF